MTVRSSREMRRNRRLAAVILMAAPFIGSAVAFQAGKADAATVPTPRQPAGSFYPSALPSDTDNDLTLVRGNQERATGTLLLLEGRVLDAAGREVADARIEIWHADADGRYPTAGSEADGNFQGYGRIETGADGRYRFRTIKPGSHSGRAPHIHVRVGAPGFGSITTQIYFENEPGNATDPVLNGIPDPAARSSVVIALSDAGEVEPGAVAGRFDIVLGHNATAPA